MDLAPVAHGAADLLSGNWSLRGLWASISPYAAWLAAAAFLIAMYLSGFGKRVRATLEELLFNNWQLSLLGAAALILSLAGGWTTWDGMRNFTGEPVLSLMFTFGIHGVMLIVAWLIGESFATGMSTVSQRGYSRATAPLLVIVGVSALVLSAGALGAYVWTYGVAADTVVKSLAITAAVLLSAFLLLFFSGSDIVAPYTQALRIIARNAMLWVMFLACMSTSVFFSFDSRFNVVFPQEERKRVADLRAQNQVTGILADISGTITARRLEQADELFKSKGWLDYDAHLAKLAGVAQGAQADIERYFVQKMEERRRGIAEQQERITTAQSGQIGLSSKKLSLTDELSNIKGERPRLVAEYAQHKSELDAKQREVDAKRIEAMAEDRGVEGTGKVGKGQVYRQRVGELGRLLDEYKIREERAKDAQRRMNAVETRIAQIERELTGIDGELAKSKGEAQTAEARIKAVEDSSTALDGAKVDPARALLSFENARAGFRQEPSVEHLAQVQQFCTQLYNALSGTPATKDKVRNIDCEPKQASEAAAPLFALNAGFVAFGNNCAGGDKLAPHTNADALFGFARKCLADSGLASKDTDALRTKISFTELTRDDRAHRFVVSWNAFGDGNRLAYLALAIAIGIDSLIFMTGLFGANAVRSPLSDVPSTKPRNAQQLESVIETALLPDKYENASAVIEALDPITPFDGFTAEVVVPREETASKRRVMKVLNAAATINAVARDPAQPDRYLVRGELFEFLSVVAKKAFDADKRHVDLAELERVVSVALLPRIGDNADTVLSYIHPIGERHGFTGEIRLVEVVGDDKRVVRSALNAGATLEKVQRAGQDANHYFVHGDFYRTLARIRGRLLMSAAPAAPAVTHGGAAWEQRERIEHGGSHRPALTYRVPDNAYSNGKHLAPEVIRDQLIQEGGLPAWSAADLKAARDLKENSSVKQLFRRLARRAPKLSRQVEAAREAYEEDIDAAVERLSQVHDHDAAFLQELKSVSYELQELLPLLMLTPGGPYEQIVSSIISKFEPPSGEGELSHEDQVLHARLKEQHAALLRLGGNDASRLKRVASIIEEFDEAMNSDAGLRSSMDLN